MPKATVSPTEIEVRHNYRPDFGHHLTFNVPNGWDDVQKISRKILHFAGRRYAFLSWNSDRNDCTFRETASVAAIKTK